MDWMSAAASAGLSMTQDSVRCPSCRNDLLPFPDATSPGRPDRLGWLVCETCETADDIFGILSRVWKSNRQTAIDRISGSRRFPTADVARYLRQVVEPRRLIGSIWQDARRRRSVLAQASTDVIRALLPASSGGTVRLRKKLEKSTVVSCIPLFDAPGRPSGLLLPDQDGPGQIVRLAGLPDHDVGVVNAAGLMDRARVAVSVNDFGLFMTLDQASWNLVGRRPIVYWSKEFTGSAAWSGVASCGRLLMVTRRLDAAALAAMVRFDGCYTTLRPGIESRLGEPLELLLDSFFAERKDWRCAMFRWLNSGTAKSELLLKRLERVGLSRDLLVSRAGHSLKLLVERLSADSPTAADGPVKSVDPGIDVRQVGDSLFLVGRGGEHRISNLTVRVLREFRLAHQGTTWLDGLIEFSGRKLPFFIPEERLTPKWLRDTVLDAGLGIPEISSRWGTRLQEISERLHGPELILVRGDAGWHQDSRELVMPERTIRLGGEIVENPLPEAVGRSFVGGLGVARPREIQLSDLAGLDRCRVAGHVSAMICGVATALLAPASGRKTPPLLLYGSGAEQLVRLSSPRLGCPVLDVRTTRDLKELDQFEECRWPSFVICHDVRLLAGARLRDWFGRGLPFRFGVVDRVTALAASATGVADVYQVSSDEKTLVAAANAMEIFFPAYLTDWCRRYGRPRTGARLVSGRVSTLRDFCLDFLTFIRAFWPESDKRHRSMSRRFSFVEPKGLCPVGAWPWMADNFVNLLAAWASSGSLRLTAAGFESPKDAGRVLSYDLDSDRLIVPIGVLDGLLADHPMVRGSGSVRDVLSAAGKLLESDEARLEISYGWWRAAAVGHKKGEGKIIEEPSQAVACQEDSD